MRCNSISARTATRCTLLFFALLDVVAKVHASPADTTKSLSPQIRWRIEKAATTVKTHLLQLPQLPFDVAVTDYNFPAFQKIRQQIMKGNLPQAKAWLMQAMQQPVVQKDPEKWVEVKAAWIEYLLNVDEFKTAYDEALALNLYADSLNVRNREVAYVSMARASFQVDDYATANTSIEKALALAKQNGNMLAEGRAELVAGTLARRYFWGNTHRSLPYYDKAIAVATSCGDTITLIRALLLKHADIAQPGNVDRGFPFFEKALDLTLHSGYLKYVPNICEHISFELEAISHTAESVFMLQQSLQRVRNFGMPVIETHMCIQISEVFASQKKYDSALYYLSQCKNEGLLAPGVRTPLLHKASVYYQMGNYNQAAILYDSGMQDYLNTFILQGQNSISRWETSMRIHDKELQIQHSKTTRLQLTWVIIAICLLLMLALWGFVRQRSLRRRLALQYHTIAQQSEALQQSLNEKELLLREVHHRVKNNLQVIESLLDMHQDKIAAPEQQQAFTKARLHIRSIAMIHQNLYQQDHLSTVNMELFTNNLFSQTESIFNKSNSPVVFNNRIKNVKLDIDTAVPLGLILSELLTNAFKYVLPHVEVMQLTLAIEQGDSPERYQMKYCDNGHGLTNGQDIKKAGSLGMELIRKLSRQIGGQVMYEYQAGSCFIISFLTAKGRKETD